MKSDLVEKSADKKNDSLNFPMGPLEKSWHCKFIVRNLFGDIDSGALCDLMLGHFHRKICQTFLTLYASLANVAKFKIWLRVELK